LNPKLPAPYLLLAKLYIQGHRDQEALANLTALVAQTNNVSAYLQMGMIHEQNMDFDKAREAYEKALTINSNNTSALNNLAYVYSERLHQPDKALPLAERNWVLAGADPIQSAFAADTLGWILLKHGDYPRAQTLLQESADRQPGDPEVRYHLGMAHYMMGEEVPARLALQEAVAKGDYEGKAEAKSALAILNIDPKQANANDRAELEKQLAAKPGDAIALMKLAEMEERDGHPDKAAAQYEAAIKANAQNLRAMVRLAQLDSGPLHQPQKGLDLAKNAHRISPEDANVSALLGRLDFEAKDYANARDLLEDASRRMPGQPDLLHDLAWSYFSVGDLNQAQATMLGAVGTSVKFEKLDDARQFLDMLSAYSSPGEPASASRVQAVLQANGTYAPALLASGSVQERQGKNNEAEQQYEKVLADFPLLAPARRQLAILYTRDNNDAKALQNLDKARAAFPDDAEVIRSSGIVAFRQNDFQKSSQWLNQVVQKGPDDPYTDYCLGMDYYALKQMTTAKKYLQLAINSKRTDRFVEDAKSVLAGLK
jgi:tetratricopeptide (TPR) repeat protein